MDVVPPPSRGRRALQGSSYVKRGLVIGLSGPDAELVLPEAAVDLVGDPSLESANRLQLGVAGRSSTQEVVASRTGIPHLREGDPVQGGVDLAVATSVEPIALVARPGWDRCGAVVHREGGAGAEATNAGRLADELGGGDHAATCKASRVGARAVARTLISASNSLIWAVRLRQRATRSHASRATTSDSGASWVSSASST